MPSNTWKPCAIADSFVNAAVLAADEADSWLAADEAGEAALEATVDAAALEAAVDAAALEAVVDAADADPDAVEAADAELAAEPDAALPEALAEPDDAEEHPTATTSANAHTDAAMTDFRTRDDFMTNSFLSQMPYGTTQIVKLKAPGRLCQSSRTLFNVGI